MDKLRVLPQNIEAEESVLSACLLHRESREIALDLLEPEDMYRGPHQKIFAAIRTLARQNEPVDLISTVEALRAAGSLQRCGGATYLARLTNEVPQAVNVRHHARLVKDASVKRRLVDHHSRQLDACFTPGASAETLLEASQSAALGIDTCSGRGGFRQIDEGVHALIDRLTEYHRNGRSMSGVPSGFQLLDARTSGFQPADLIILAGRPSMGKTALALNIAENAERDGYPVGIFSLEMSEGQLVGRLIARKARINGERFKGDRFDAGEWERIIDAAGELGESKIYINDRDGALGAIRRDCRRMRRQHGVELVIIDYLQLIRTSSRGDRRDLEIAEITRSLKSLAKELEIPVIALSQLNRKVEERADKRPLMSDLRESGAIEQDADVIAFIYRDEVYNREADNPNAGVAEIIIAKNRQGDVGTLRLAWVPQHLSFYNLPN